MTSSSSTRPGRWLVATVAALTMAAVTACGAGSPEPGGAGTGEPVTIRFASYNYGTPDLGGEGTQQLIDEFQASHPDIRIEPEGASAADLYAKVQAESAAGNPPDIAQIGWSRMLSAVSTLNVSPIQDIADPARFAALTEDLVPSALAAGVIEDRLVSMPYTISTPTLFVNVDLFTAAGLDPANPPRTWEEAKAAALAIHEATQEQGIYLAAANAAKSDFVTQSLINSNGGSLISDTGEIQLDTPAALGALSMLADLTASGAQPAIPDNDAVALFKAGKLGMYLTSTALLSSFQTAAEGNFELRTASMPQFGDQPARPTYSGSGLVVLSQDDAHRAAALEFIEFLTSERGFTIITEKIGYLPLRTAILDDPAYLGPYLENDPSILPALDQLVEAQPYQSLEGPRGDQARQVLQDDAVSPIMLQGADPATTLAEVDRRISELLVS